jgi:hypothetical protein
MVEKKEVEVEEAQKQEPQNGMETDQQPQSPGDAPQAAAAADGQNQEPMEVQEVSCVKIEETFSLNFTISL